ncbi:PH domain-containing protein [Thalassotalea sp. Y01]|uniref:PH domain-containing protein n=1 Tax=Thalassotalea sp. Y01 TaxID=2729613 RepID=UPI00145C6F06|nr:PH domain-containing protein [Thalassotalea sp. Y01]NMP16305.1 PH domain-containing protein [Thalassotalea sp. Y01]
MDSDSSDFENRQIDHNQFTSLQQLDFQPLSEKYPPAHRMVSLASTLVILLLLVFILFQPFVELPDKLLTFFSIVCFVWSFIGLIIFAYRYFADPKKAFAIRQQDISYKSGLIFRSIITQPILRIQHVELKRGPIDRKLGLACLQVFSAGGSMHTFEIPGLELADAENMRQYILSHKDLGLHG